ncbi:MAG: biotin-dependent carboxyltransferase family protein [Jatrophihabitans sp.]|uniref:5-oxoprolinase subunit C family protein n=1 Tax=Jatrophihabitans sp. TaxID=1932789 RepID=UPI003915FAAE
MIDVLAPGPLATVQDRGRVGFAALGVARSGAFDRAALDLANRLVGNPGDAAAIEMTFGGLHVRLADPATVALTGAVCPGAPDWGAAVSLPQGAEIRLGPPPEGLRSYLAVRGGLAVDPVLGSRSTDTLSGLGPPPLRAGDRLPVGGLSGALVGATSAEPSLRDPVLPVQLGPRDDWFTVEARHSFFATAWTVRTESDRVGIRLDGAPLERARDEELASEPTLPGAVQVAADGRPIVFGPDAPVTGGYPVIAVVTDLGRAAQLRPGDVLRFSPGRG